MTQVLRPAVCVIASALLFAGCGGKTVTRVEPETTTDLSGRWNDTDSRLVSQAMIQDCLNAPWLTRHQTTAKPSERPVVIVGVIRNKSMEHIPVDTFIKDIERTFITDGRVRVVADAGDRGDIRAERESMQGNVTPETLKKFGKELGADYVMMGEINQIIDQEGGQKVSFYQTNLELIHVESNEKVWIGDKKIKKVIGRSKYSG
ncbi:MAG: penicillin-binding protein activator LpoB [bacterium]